MGARSARLSPWPGFGVRRGLPGVCEGARFARQWSRLRRPRVSLEEAHQDGLVPISALSNTYVKDPHTVVKAGQVVKVKVLEVDEKRKRIALTMRLNDTAPAPGARNEQRGDRTDSRRLSQHQNQRGREQAPANNAMAAAFAKLRG